MFKNEAKYQLAPFVLPVFVGFLAMFLPLFGEIGVFAFTIGLIGFGLLIYAKISEKMRSGKAVNWGYAGMSFREKTSYFIGYIMILSYLGLSIYFALLSSSDKVVL